MQKMVCSMLLMALATIAEAQQTVVASDVDLAASYCLGVVRRQVSAASQLASQYRGETNYAALFAQNQKDLQERLERLRAYLLPKFQYVDTLQLAAATQRGEADFDSIPALIDRAGAQCLKGTPVERLQCITEQTERLPVSERMGRCKRLDFLPF